MSAYAVRSPTGEPNSSFELSTPIKKIRNLTLNLPNRFTSPNRPGNSPIYPSLTDITSSMELSNNVSTDMASNMIGRGYSKTITNKVLNELNMRATEISLSICAQQTAPTLAPNPTERRKKRYSGIHRSKFNKMDSISSHYAASRTHNDRLPVKTALESEFKRSQNVMDVEDQSNDAGKRNSTIDISSINKRRRTLNGPEEVLHFQQQQQQKLVRKVTPPQHPGALSSPIRHSEEPMRTQLLPAPVLENTPSLQAGRSSPVREDRLSPARKISPSKGSMNLNGLLTSPESDNMHLDSSPKQRTFLKPTLPVHKRRPSLLELAGVKSTNTPSLQHKTSIPKLQHKTSNSRLTKKPSLSDVNYNNAVTSIPKLSKKPSIPTLERKPPIPGVDRKPSIPTLNKKPSSTGLNSGNSVASSYGSASTSYLKTSVLHKKPSSSSISATTQKPRIYRDASSSSISSTHSKVTVPQPFSLYNRPTILSSQKSMGLYEKPTVSTSQKSLNKFQRFKDRFH